MLGPEPAAALRSGDQSEAARALSDALDLTCAMDLGEERGEWITATDSVTGGLEQAEPLLVVDRLSGPDLAVQDVDSNIAQTLAPQSRVQVFQTELSVTTEQRGQLAEQMLVARGVLLYAVGEHAKPIGALALFDDLCEQARVLGLDWVSTWL